MEHAELVTEGLRKKTCLGRFKITVNSVLIITKPGDRSLLDKTKELAIWLMNDDETKPARTVYVASTCDRKVTKRYSYLDHKLKNNARFNPTELEDKYTSRLRYWTPELCMQEPESFDIVITLGGDGTVLYASYVFQHVAPPVLSFSLGSLGFLAPFNFADFKETLSTSFGEGIKARVRMRFECRVMRLTAARRRALLSRRIESVENSDENPEEDIILLADDSTTYVHAETFTVLNELVVDRGPYSSMSVTELYGDNEHLTTVLADGLVIATPTGSTAYSLSAGGSLTHPGIPAMLVSPICPHTLSFRPLLVPDTMVLRVLVPIHSRTTCYCSFDGRHRVELQHGDFVSVSASEYPFTTVLHHGQSSDWFASLGRNLNFNDRRSTHPAAALSA